MTDQIKGILFLCVANSARSQLAEGLARAIFGNRIPVQSAGSEPSRVNPFAVEVMREIGIDIGAQKPKTVDVYLGRVPVHYLIVVCNKAQATCPRIWPGLMEGNRYYWPLDDPAAVSGGFEEQLAVFRAVRDELQEKLREWVNGLKL